MTTVSTSSTVSDEELAQHLAGELPEPRAKEVAALIKDNADVQRRFHQLQRLTALLGTDDARLGPLDLVPAVAAEVTRTVPRAGTGAPRARLFALVTAGLAAAAGLILWVSPGTPLPGPEQDPVARGGTPVNASCGLEVFRVNAAGASQRLGAQLPAGDALAFAYRNQGNTPATHLAVLGVDARGAVHWYFPPDGAGDAPAMAIRPGAHVELEDMVRKDLPRGPLVLVAVFGFRPFAAAELARGLARAGWARADGAADGGALPLLVEGTVQQVILTEVH